MKILEGFRRRGALKRAMAELQAGAPAEAIGSLDVRGLLELADRLSEEGDTVRALEVIDRARFAAPEDWDVLVTRADLLREAGHTDAALEAFHSLQRRDPRHQAVARICGELLTQAGRPKEAVAMLEPFSQSADARTRVTLAQAAFAAGDAARTAAILEPLLQARDLEARASIMGSQSAYQETQELTQLFEAAVAESQGQEEIVVAHAKRGDLVASAGVNYRLLAGSLMARSERIAARLELLSPEATEEEGRRLLAVDPESLGGLCQLGSAALRRGQLAEAREIFLKLREQDASNFAALAGYGCVLDVQNKGLRGLARKLGAVGPVPPELLAVVPDWTALTDLEQRVVQASIRPLGWLLPTLAQQNATMRILPLDVRVVDRPEFLHLLDERDEHDHRAFAALQGVTGHTLGCAKVEELLDVVGEGWTFAHEFAHLVHNHLGDEDYEAVQQLYELACERSFEVDQYQLKDEFEFFAVEYTEYLGRTLGLRGMREVETEVSRQATALFETFAARPPAGSRILRLASAAG